MSGEKGRKSGGCACVFFLWNLQETNGWGEGAEFVGGKGRRTGVGGGAGVKEEGTSSGEALAGSVSLSVRLSNCQSPRPVSGASTTRVPYQCSRF